MNTKQPVVLRSNPAGKCFWAFLVIVTLVDFSFAQTISGTLSSSNTTTTSSGTCSIRTTTSAWTFTDNLSVAHSFPGSTTTQLLLGCSSSCNPRGLRSACTTLCGCPPSGSTSVNEWSSDRRFWLAATGTSGTVSREAGYVNPKFLVVGVTYAPPGLSASTFVSYANSSFVGSTQSLSDSFMGSTTRSVSLTSGLHIPLVAKASISDTFATTATQSNKSSFTVTSSIQASSGETTFATGRTILLR